jgi:type I restriction enzyme S subunit
MPAVAEEGQGIIGAELRPYSEVAKGYTHFAEGDVLFAKITPRMQNGKHAVARNLRDGIGFGSTEFHVIRPRDGVVPEWLHLFLIQPWVLRDAMAHFTGAVGQQRVPQTYLAGLHLPIPPLPEQRGILELLTEQLAAVERARASGEAQIRAAKELPVAQLRCVFDGLEAHGWPMARLGDVLRLRKEVVHPRDYPSGTAVFVGLEHIESQTGVRTGQVEVEMSRLTGRKPRFHPGDTVYGYLRPYLNKVWVADFEGLCSVDQYVYDIRRDTADANFIAWFMRSPVYLERAPIDKTPGQLPRIRTEEVARVPVNLPPLDEQRRIAARLAHQADTAQRLRGAALQQLESIRGLPAALLRGAFSGELVRPTAIIAPKLPPGIVFKRGAVAAYVINRLHDRSTFGRVQLMKALYLTETHVGVDLAGRYVRAAAGPYDAEALYNLESLAWKKGWFTKHKRGKEGHRYQPGPFISDRLRAASVVLGERQQAMDRLLDLLSHLDTEQAEIVATLFAAWNDFLLDGQHPSEEQIIREVRDNWRESKMRFAEERLRLALVWMRSHQLTPRGIGPHTEPAHG